MNKASMVIYVIKYLDNPIKGIKVVYMYRQDHSPINFEIFSCALALHWPQNNPSVAFHKNSVFL